MKILNYILKMFALLIDKREKERDELISMKKVSYKSIIILILLLIIYLSCSIELKKLEAEKNYKYFFVFHQ